MTMVLGTGAILAVTYFTPNASSPVSLNIGDTLLTTMTFTFNGVPPFSHIGGISAGVCSFGANRVSADFSSNSSQGANVPGYGLFQTMGVTFNNSTPMDLRARTNLTVTSLLGTASDWKSLTTGPGNTNAFPGFTTSNQYTLQLSLQRLDTGSLQYTATWLNTANGSTLSTTVTDNAATNFNFDGIALRPQNAARLIHEHYF